MITPAVRFAREVNRISAWSEALGVFGVVVTTACAILVTAWVIIYLVQKYRNATDHHRGWVYGEGREGRTEEEED
jgi:hypothetical protein